MASTPAWAASAASLGVGRTAVTVVPDHRWRGCRRRRWWCLRERRWCRALLLRPSQQWRQVQRCSRDTPQTPSPPSPRRHRPGGLIGRQRAGHAGLEGVEEIEVSSGNTTCVSGSPNRQLNSMTLGPAAVSIIPAYSTPLYGRPSARAAKGRRDRHALRRRARHRRQSVTGGTPPCPTCWGPRHRRAGVCGLARRA